MTAAHPLAALSRPRRVAVAAVALLVVLAPLKAGISTPAAHGAYGDRTLRLGMRGGDVRLLQRYLTWLGFATKRDAIFGRATRRSVVRLQRRRKWRATGRVQRRQALRIRRQALRQRRSRRRPGRYFYDRLPPPSAVVQGNRSGTAIVAVLEAESGAHRQSLAVELQGGSPASVRWYGRDANNVPVRDGRYRFAIADAGGTGARIVGGETGPFTIYRHIFPVRGPYSYGGGSARFGAPRSGHSHQGQDVFARCGTRLLAAAGGTVRYRGFQGSGAGHYVVIRARVNGQDYAYMHLRRPTWHAPGSRVSTGQRIGGVGQTGNASGCHLHFERWSRPGWWSGGRPFDPYQGLRWWGSYSSPAS